VVYYYIPAPVIFDPLKDVFPVASAPSKLALLKFACRKWSFMQNTTEKKFVVTVDWRNIFILG